MASSISRAGRFVKQPAGYTAFVPAPLPPDPPIRMDVAMVGLLSRADQAVGRLDGVTRTLPNPDLFVAMYVRREAVLSSQIEGIQSTLEDVLSYELDPRRRDVPQDVEEVVNYVRAMNYGLERLATLPLSLRLIREIHAELMSGVRGANRLPGEFRRSQNWIGPGGASLSQATFVPPPVPEMTEALYDLEKFLHEEDDLPVLVRCGLAHAQFETIHPFFDGNGRVGRLLITFQLVDAGVLHRPLLYISHYLKRHRAEYYDRLGAIRQGGDWEGRLRFFLRGIAETAEEATATAEAIVGLREEHRALLQDEGLGLNGLRLLDLLFQRPLVNVNLVRDTLGVRSYNTANNLVEQLAALGLLEEMTGGQRNRVFRYTPYWRLLEEPEPGPGQDVTVQTTESAEQ
jgi:Fic family protein